MRGHAALLLLALALGLAPSIAAQDKSTTEVESAWARASIGTARPAAAYVTLVNTGSEAMRLVAVETPVAGRAEAHRSVMPDRACDSRSRLGGGPAHFWRHEAALVVEEAPWWRSLVGW